ncbi:MAG: transglycosylase domain-containing protein [Bacteroidia bacterium]
MKKLFHYLSYLSLNHYIKNKWLLWPVRLILWILIYVFFLQTNFLWLTGDIPTLTEIKNPAVAIATDLLTADSVLIGRYYIENRTPITYDKMSPWLTKALVSTEDVRFYKHHGLDLYAVFSGLWQTAQGDNRGGSTITQQLVKNVFKTRAVGSQGLLRHVPGLRTIIYKTKEWLTAIKLESFFSKQEILELYFNSVDFGNNWYGVKVASNNYFSKQPADLNVEEAAVLIGMLKATTTYNPKRNPAKSRERRNVVLSQMLKYGDINKQVYDSVSALPLQLTLRKIRKTENDDSYIRQYVENRLSDWCASKSINLYEDGLKIYTTINSKLQKFAEDAMYEQLKRLQQQFNELWANKNPWIDDDGKEIPNFIEDQVKLTSSYKELVRIYGSNTDTIEKILHTPKPMKVFTWNGPKDTTFSTYDSVSYYARIMQSGMMCWDPFTGQIVAYVGGIDHNFFKYDKVTQSKRQPGSTFKPFAYLTAIDKGCDPCDVFQDRPVRIEYNKDEIWEPHNATYSFTYEYKTLRRAMAQSCNSVTAQLTEVVGWNNVATYAHLCGIKSHLDEVPSICLGSSDVSVYEMANAYGTIMNDGNRCEPLIVSKICDVNGKVIEEFKPRFTKVLSDETTFLMRYMFLGAMEEPEATSLALWGYNLFANQNQIGGKTGTTSNNGDAWYAGLTKNLVTVIWVGTDYRSIHLKRDAGQGSRVALPIFGKFMEKAIASKNPLVQVGRWPKPKERIRRQYEGCTGNTSSKKDTTLIDSLQMQLMIDSLKKDINDTTVHE